VIAGWEPAAQVKENAAPPSMDPLDKVTLEFDCLTCGFSNPATMGQIRLGDVVICRGCKATIRLDDVMGDVGKARQLIRDMISNLRGCSFKISLRI
jgi:hypothetical protein